MSSRPSPLKSPVSQTDQVTGTPIIAFASFGVNPPLELANQLLIVPLEFRHRMSSRPSPLKSPVPLMNQSLGAVVQAFASLIVKPPAAIPSQLLIVPLE